MRGVVIAVGAVLAAGVTAVALATSTNGETDGRASGEFDARVSKASNRAVASRPLGDARTSRPDRAATPPASGKAVASPKPTSHNATASRTGERAKPWDNAEERRAATAINTLNRAMSSGDVDTACAIMGKRIVERNVQLTRGGANTTCEQVTAAFATIMRGTDALAAFGRTKVVDVEVDGDRGYVISTLDGQTTRAPLRKVGGQWKLANIGRPVELAR